MCRGVCVCVCVCVCITFCCTAVHLAPGFYIGSVNYSEQSHLNRSGLDPLQNMAFDRRKKPDLFSLSLKDQAQFDLCLYITRSLFRSFLPAVSSMLPYLHVLTGSISLGRFC